MEHPISHGQLKALTLVSMLCPFLRLLPGAITKQAGSAAWVSALLALIPAVLLYLMLTALGKAYPRQALGEQILLCFGRFPGSVLLCLWSLWLVVHGGFLLRSGADRFISTVYPGSSPAAFILITLVLCVIAADGTVEAMARLSVLLRPLLLGVILLVLIFSLEEVEPAFLLPVIPQQAESIGRGILSGAEPISLALVIAAFLQKYVSPHKKTLPLLSLVIGSCLLAAGFCAVCIGSLGKTYTAAAAYPFFVLARDLSIFSGVERIEALVVALWFLPDFVLITAELLIVLDNLTVIAGTVPSRKSKRIRLAVLAAVAALAAFGLPADGPEMLRLSDTLVPAIHLFWAYGTVPLLLLAALLRKRF